MSNKRNRRAGGELEGTIKELTGKLINDQSIEARGKIEKDVERNRKKTYTAKSGKGG